MEAAMDRRSWINIMERWCERVDELPANSNRSCDDESCGGSWNPTIPHDVPTMRGPSYRDPEGKRQWRQLRVHFTPLEIDRFCDCHSRHGYCDHSETLAQATGEVLAADVEACVLLDRTGRMAMIPWDRIVYIDVR